VCRPFTFLVELGLCLVVGAGVIGCGHAPPAGQDTGPPTVTVACPIQREVTDHAEYPGRTAAVDSLQVRARVSGYLEKINFKEGADVQQGDVLCEIDPRPYLAQLKAAQAQLAQSEANLRLAQENNARYRTLAKQQPGAVSPQQLDQYQAQEDQARASVELARANLETAELNLGWTRVTSPISGRIGRTLVTRGNLVVADQTVLTTVVSQDPMYAYFDVDEPTVLRVRDLIREGKFKSAREEGVRVPVFLGLATEEGYPHEGYVDFINNQVEPSTGTLQVRAVFPNPKPPVGDRILSAGLFVRVQVRIGLPYRALLVNQRAIGTDQNLKFVYVVDPENKVARRDVRLGPQEGPPQVIAEGLKPDDHVVLSRLQQLRPGMVVSPRLVEMPTTPAPSQPPAPSPSVNGTVKPTPQQAAPSVQQNPPPTATKQ
jgi:RND family efflux transporter MFP subunit